MVGRHGGPQTSACPPPIIHWSHSDPSSRLPLASSPFHRRRNPMAASPKAVFLRKIGFFYNVKQNTWNSIKQQTTPELDVNKNTTLRSSMRYSARETSSKTNVAL